MAETHFDGVLTMPALLDIGQDIGALVLYTGAELRDKEIEVSPTGDDAKRVHTAIHERRVNGRTIFAGIYPALREGDYTIWGESGQPAGHVTITGGKVAKVDWRE